MAPFGLGRKGWVELDLIIGNWGTVKVWGEVVQGGCQAVSVMMDHRM